MEGNFMCYTGGPRCPSSAKKKLAEALKSGDKNKIRDARIEWFTTTPGIQELRDRGRHDAADRFQARRDALIDRSKVLDRQAKGLTVAVDLDNTTGDFTAAFRDSLAKKYGLSPKEAKERYPDPHDYSFVESGWFDSKEEFLSEMREAEENGMYARMSIYSGARKTLRDLRARGYNIHFVTARHDDFNEDTKAALRKWRLGYDKLVHEGTKQNYHDAHVFIDDAPYQINALTMHGKDSITFNNTYNAHIEGARVNDWTEVAPLVDKKLAAIKKKVESRA